MNEFRKLKTSSLAGIKAIDRPQHCTALNLDSPASEVLTDFSRETPLMLEQSTAIDEARALMEKTHVKLKLVIDASEAFSGVVSLSDLLSVKVMQAMNRTGLKREDLTVGEVMTRKDALHAIDIACINGARIGDLLATMRTYGDQHVLVVDSKRQCICGLVSANDIARNMNIPIHINERANSFAQIYDAVRH
jgi:CBS-domain-containing membrane protein